ncbi:hypothetical protein [Streptomyces sp. NBC_00233]|uniref:hypothetical protein n=1 Tax=Streptomyces sp. NBC_00233 TaxID=2975686 RepID=UPI002253F33D|nr:hypothetical protein [Streptomyces sp. NBC_00233]MCX5232942.1 hypothetical protein [Streptomyces sp. NBC_00233]
MSELPPDLPRLRTPMAHLIFGEDEARQLRESARECAAAGEGLLACTLEQLAAEGIDLSKATP